MWYIVWTDKFFSGWGHAKSKSNRCFFGPIESARVAKEIIDLIKGTRDEWIRWDYTHGIPNDTASTITSYVDLRGWLSRVAPKRYKALKKELFLCPSQKQTKSNRRGYRRTVKNPLGTTTLTSKEEAALFKAFMKMKYRVDIKNIRLSRRRGERITAGGSGILYIHEGRSASWMHRTENGSWFKASCSYLSDEGF
ncbi:MAG: hypothetical protein P1Q69_10520 [Candidatus Thorarchaeota archaeon]|nr:hypothetical protein [Candidatus Thorarchaeota archaeon]